MEKASLSKPFSQSEEGFALPQILLLSIILGVVLTSLLAASIYRLSSSKINTLEINTIHQGKDSEMYIVRKIEDQHVWIIIPRNTN